MSWREGLDLQNLVASTSQLRVGSPDVSASVDTEDVTSISVFQDQGIGPNIVKALENGGLTSVEMVARTSKDELLSKCGISESVADLVLIAAYASISFTLSPGTDFPGLGVVDISSLSPPPVGNTISAGVNSINELLGGGIMRGNVYEFVGTGGTGKSNLCFQLAVSTMLPPYGGGVAGKCIFLYTTPSLATERIVCIGRRFQLGSDQVLSNILTARVYNTDHLIKLVHEAMAHLESRQYGIVIVDNPFHLFRSEYFSHEFGRRDTRIRLLLTRLYQIAERFSAAVVFTNEVTTVFGSGPAADIGTERAYAGDVLETGKHTRIWMKRSDDGKRSCHVFSSPIRASQPTYASFLIDNQGLHDDTD